MQEENGGHDEPEVELDLVFGGTSELCILDQQPHLVTMSNSGSFVIVYCIFLNHVKMTRRLIVR